MTTPKSTLPADLSAYRVYVEVASQDEHLRWSRVSTPVRDRAEADSECRRRAALGLADIQIVTICYPVRYDNPKPSHIVREPWTDTLSAPEAVDTGALHGPSFSELLRASFSATYAAEQRLVFSGDDWTPETEQPYREAQRRHSRQAGPRLTRLAPVDLAGAWL